MSRPLFVKVNNAWKEGVPYIKVGNTWKQITKLSTKVSGVWQPWKLEESHEHIYTISYTWSSNKCTAKAVCSCGDQITETKTGTYRKRTTATCCQVLVYDYYVYSWQNSHVFSGPKYSPDYYGEKDYTNHTGLNSFTAKAATCTSNGWKAHSVCSGCGKYYDANGTETTWEKLVIPKAHVNLTAVNAKAATCSTEGHKAYSYCSGCNNYYVDGNKTTWEKLVIPKDPDKHSKVNTFIRSKDRYQHGTLNVCSACKTEWWTDVANHTWEGDDRYGYNCTGGCGSTAGPCKHFNVTSTGTDATCTTDGYRTYTCKDCGYTWSETQSATGHNTYIKVESNGNGTHSKVQYCYNCTYRKAANSSQACSADTCEGTTCKQCGATISAAGHKWTTIAAKVDATCTTAGKTAKEKCSKCGTTRGGTTIAKLGHLGLCNLCLGGRCTRCGFTKRYSPSCSKNHNIQV